MKLHKFAYIGLSTLMIASVGGLSNINNVNAKNKTKIVHITHLKKWQRNRLNHAKYLRNKNNHKINSIKHYLKHHKHAKNQHKILYKLIKQNKNLNNQIYRFSFKKIVLNLKKHAPKVNKKRKVNKKSYTTINFEQFIKALNKGVNYYDNGSSRRAERNLLKSHVKVNVNGETIAINKPKDISNVIFVHNRERAEQNAQQTQSENNYVQNEINNSMPSSVQQQFANMQNE